MPLRRHALIGTGQGGEQHRQRRSGSPDYSLVYRRGDQLGKSSSPGVTAASSSSSPLAQLPSLSPSRHSAPIPPLHLGREWRRDAPAKAGLNGFTPRPGGGMGWKFRLGIGDQPENRRPGSNPPCRAGLTSWHHLVPGRRHVDHLHEPKT